MNKTIISVKDKLPKVGRDIIAYHGFEELCECGFISVNDTKKKMRKGKFIDFSFTVTHWIYLPED